MPIPLEKSFELISEINAMIPMARDDARIEEIEREAQKIAAAGFYYQAKVIEGMLAGLKGDEQGVRTKFRAALLSSGGDLVVRTNYAQALFNLHFVRDAIVEIDYVCQEAPDDVSILLEALTFHHNAFDFEGSASLIEKIKRLGGFDKIPDSIKSDVLELSDLLKTSCIEWEIIADRIELASRAITSIGLHATTITQYGDESGVLYEFDINGDLNDAIRAENAIHQSISSQPFTKADSFISFACAPV